MEAEKFKQKLQIQNSPVGNSSWPRTEWSRTEKEKTKIFARYLTDDSIPNCKIMMKK